GAEVNGLGGRGVGGRLRRIRRLFLDGLDDDGHLADLQEVADAQRPLAVAQLDAVEAGAVGAAQVAHAPAALGEANFRVAAADRNVVEDDLQWVEAPDAQQFRRLPRTPLDGAV